MTLKMFNEEYGVKGGMMELNEMRALKKTLQEIGVHFGVSKQRVAQWLTEFFGSSYDCRYDRRESVIQSMVDFSTLHSKEEFHEAFKHSEYYKEAIAKTSYDIV